MLIDMKTPLIKNTVMQKSIDDETGRLISYRIYPVDGYMLHTNTLDEPVIDESTFEETGEVKLGYTDSLVTAGYNYDFDLNPREIYAVKIDKILV